METDFPRNEALEVLGALDVTIRMGIMTKEEAEERYQTWIQRQIGSVALEEESRDIDSPS